MSDVIFKNGIASLILRVKLIDTSAINGYGKTGLAFNSAGLIISTLADNEAAATTYTQAGSTIETITTLGTFAAPTATKCRFKEVDATNFPGLYEIQIADARWAVSGARYVDVSLPQVTGLNTAPLIRRIQLWAFDPQTATQPVNVTQWSGTTVATPDTAGYPKTTNKVGTGTGEINLSSGAVPIQAGTGTGQLDFTSGVVKANLTQILGTLLTETSGQIAAAFKKLFDTSTPVLTAQSVNQTGDNFARIGAPAGASVSADIAAVKTDSAAVKVQTDKLAFTVANQVDSNVIDWKGATAPAMTGDAFARLGVPAGASIAADIAEVEGETDGIIATLGAAGAGLTALGDTRIANLDATVSSRTKPADTQARVTLVDMTTAVSNDVGITQAGADKVWGTNARTLTAFGFTVAANLTQILGTALTETAGWLAAGFKKFFNVATPTSTMNQITLVDTTTTLTNAPVITDPLANAVPGTYPVGTAGYDLGLLPGINARVGSGTITVLSPIDSRGSLTLKQWQTYAAAIGTQIQVTVAVPVDPSGGVVTWTFPLGSATQSFTGSVVSYNSSAKTAVLGLELTSAESGGVPFGTSRRFAVGIALPSSQGEDIPIAYQNSSLTVLQAPPPP